ncbi:MAG: tol-pal system protein YbgF [Alphaproteobacteria bacterium]
MVTLRTMAAALAIVLLPLCTPAGAQESDLAQQLQRVRRDLSDLQAYIYSGKAPSREAVAGMAAESSDSTARLQVQLQNLETQVRDLTGRIEEAEHGVSRASERLEKLIADLEIRFQALEAGKGQTGGVAPGAAPGGAAAVPERRTEGRDPGPAATPLRKQVAEGLAPGQQVFGTMSKSGGATAVKPPVKTLPERADGTPASGADEGEQLASAAGGPRARYDAAFQHLQQREYEKAATGFDAFVKENPDSPLSSNALYWLGETHYVRKDYAEAARVYLDGYKRYPKGNKAPDNLLKLGMSLAAINEKQSACAAWNKLVKAYPTANKRLLTSAKSELGKLGCS